MKKKWLSVLVAVMLLASVVGTAFADLPGGGWVTNTQIQNVGVGATDIQVTSYGGGAQYSSATKNAVPGGSVTFLSSDLNLPAAFSGAGVVSSTEPIFAILFVTNYGTGAGNTGSAIVRGIGQDNTDVKLSFPLAKKRWGSGQKTTSFYIQNAGSAVAHATVTMSILGSSPAGQTCSNNARSYTINASEQINFSPADLGCPNGVFGAVTVVSDGQPLAGIVLEHDDDMNAPAGGSKVLQGTSGFSPKDYDTTLIAPIIKKGWGQNNNVTGLQVQNVGAAPIPAGDLVVTYTIVGSKTNPASVGTTVTESNTDAIAVGAAFNSLHGVLANGTLASAVVTVKAGEQIVGIVNENRPAGTPVFRNTTYSMLAAKSASTSVSLPLVKEYFGGQGGRCTGVQVVAVGGANKAVMELTYKATTGETFVATTSAAEGVKTFLRLSDNFTPGVNVTGGAASAMRGKNFGVTAKSLTAGVKLVAVANESFCPNSARDEDDANYEGFPLP